METRRVWRAHFHLSEFFLEMAGVFFALKLGLVGRRYLLIKYEFPFNLLKPGVVTQCKHATRCVAQSLCRVFCEESCKQILRCLTQERVVQFGCSELNIAVECLSVL